jgi:methylated-DNA-[protein]-cysteine S-methyltransferase
MRMKTQEKILAATLRHRTANVTVLAKKKGNRVVVESISLALPGKTAASGIVCPDDPGIKKIANQIRDFLSAGTEHFDKVHLDLSWCTTFQKNVLLAARSIPRGRVVSYSELARNAGFPRAVRAVASVMRNNRFPLVVPCHRVIGKNGNIGGFMGATRGKAVLLKKKLLMLEGARVVAEP